MITQTQRVGHHDTLAALDSALHQRAALATGPEDRAALAGAARARAQRSTPLGIEDT